MRIKLTSIMVNDQDRALKFYTEVLGFQKKQEIPVGAYRWITVVSPEGPDDLELSLEPMRILREKPSRRRCWHRAFRHRVRGCRYRERVCAAQGARVVLPASPPRPGSPRSRCSPIHAVT